MKSRFLKFTLFLALVFAGLEAVARWNAPSFAALSNALLLKVKILERSPDTNILFLGTSRFVDAIDQNRFSEELRVLTGENWKALNGANTGGKNSQIEYFAKVASENGNITHVIIEASPYSLESGALNLPKAEAEPEELTAEENSRFADRIENWFQHSVRENIALVKYRKAMRPKVLVKLLVLFTSDWIDPNVWSRRGLARSIFSRPDLNLDESFAKMLIPKITTSDSEAIPDAAGVNESFRANIVKISEIFKKSEIEVIWVAPPVSESNIAHSSGASYDTLYRDIARDYGTVFYDYAGIGIGDEYLRDPSHLNAKGRIAFSTLLARAVKDHFPSGETN